MNKYVARAQKRKRRNKAKQAQKLAHQMVSKRRARDEVKFARNSDRRLRRLWLKILGRKR